MKGLTEYGMRIPYIVLSEFLDVLATFYNVFDGATGKRSLSRIYLGLFVITVAIILTILIFTN